MKNYCDFSMKMVKYTPRKNKLEKHVSYTEPKLSDYEKGSEIITISGYYSSDYSDYAVVILKSLFGDDYDKYDCNILKFARGQKYIITKKREHYTLDGILGNVVCIVSRVGAGGNYYVYESNECFDENIYNKVSAKNEVVFYADKQLEYDYFWYYKDKSGNYEEVSLEEVDNAVEKAVKELAVVENTVVEEVVDNAVEEVADNTEYVYPCDDDGIEIEKEYYDEYMTDCLEEDSRNLENNSSLVEQVSELENKYTDAVFCIMQKEEELADTKSDVKFWKKEAEFWKREAENAKKEIEYLNTTTTKKSIVNRLVSFVKNIIV